jgi:uncharacterized protein (TIRG00374 family)
MLPKIIIALILIAAVAFAAGKAVNFDQLFDMLAKLTAGDIWLIALLSSTILLLKSIRFSLLLKDRVPKISWLAAIKTFFSSEALAILPGGDSARVYMLNKEEGAPPHKTAGPVFSQSAFDLIIATILATGGAFIYPMLRLPVAIIDIILILILGIFLWDKAFQWTTSQISHIPKLSSFEREATKWRKELVALLTAQSFRIVPGRATIYSLLLAIAIMSVGGLLFHHLSSLAGKEMAWPLATLMYASSIVIAAVGGIVPGGLGIAESGIVGLLYTLGGMNFQQAITTTILYRAATLLFNTVIGLLAAGSRYSFHVASSLFRSANH